MTDCKTQGKIEEIDLLVREKEEEIRKLKERREKLYTESNNEILEKVDNMFIRPSAFEEKTFVHSPKGDERPYWLCIIPHYIEYEGKDHYRDLLYTDDLKKLGLEIQCIGTDGRLFLGKINPKS